MTKKVFENANRVQLTGALVKDAFVNSNVARFRVAHNTGKDRPAVFMDAVMFPNEKREIPADLLKKGTKVVITGHLHVNERTAEDGKKYQNIEIVVDEIHENIQKEIEVAEPVSVQLSEDDDQATA